MKRIVINDDSLEEEDLDFKVIRVKALLVNSRGDVLLAHNNGTYQFPGGHKEDDESLEDALIREVKEETGINLDIDEGPFIQITTLDNNYFDTDKKVSNRIYYYRILCDDVPDFYATNYDELECQTDFDLFYISLNQLSTFLRKSIEDGSIDSKIGREMLLVLDEYNYVFGGI